MIGFLSVIVSTAAAAAAAAENPEHNASEIPASECSGVDWLLIFAVLLECAIFMGAFGATIWLVLKLYFKVNGVPI